MWLLLLMQASFVGSTRFFAQHNHMRQRAAVPGDDAMQCNGAGPPSPFLGPHTKAELVPCAL